MRRAVSTKLNSRGLRIALVTEAAGGGVAVHLADLVRELAELRQENHEVHLVLPEGDRLDRSIISLETLSACASVSYLKVSRGASPKDFRAWLQLRKILKAIDPDVVHSHSSKAGVLARMCRGPWKQVYTPHAVYTLNPYISRISRLLFGGIECIFGRFFSDQIIAVSTSEMHHFQKFLKVPSEKVCVVFNGIGEVESIERHLSRSILGLSESADLIVGFVGRFEHQKGIDRLMRIAKAVHEQVGSRVLFALVGDSTTADRRDLVNLPSNVRLLGKLPAARNYFKAFDLLLVPSRYEGFPYVYLEAMASHVPVLASNVAGTDDIVINFGMGVSFENSDSDCVISSYASEIVSLMDDRARLGQMAHGARSVGGAFSTKRMVQKILAIYS